MTALNRAKARAVLTGLPLTHQTLDRVLVALEACVVPDPRITRIEALLDERERRAHNEEGYTLTGGLTGHLRAILRGEHAEDEQTEFWAVYGGQGGRRIAQDLPSREAAEEVKRKFDHRLRDYMMPRTTIEQQHGRYGNG